MCETEGKDVGETENLSVSIAEFSLTNVFFSHETVTRNSPVPTDIIKLSNSCNPMYYIVR